MSKMTKVNRAWLFVVAWGMTLAGACGEHEKVAGLTLEAPPAPFEEGAFDGILAVAPQWVAIVPYAFVSPEEPEVQFDQPGQWWGERLEGTRAQVEAARARGLKVMIKPQLWVGGGEYTGFLKFATREKWEAWEASYRDYILSFADLAEDTGAEALCIGTELDEVVRRRPDFWPVLASACRERFGGKLTYAANWNTYEEARFWGELDAIGVNAYFPIERSNAAASWEGIRAELEAMALRYGKPVVFTEYGYRSVEGTEREPWAEVNGRARDEAAQVWALSELYEAVWEEPWFAGGFLWKWFLRPRHEGVLATGYTVQGKPAAQVVRQRYAQDGGVLQR